MRYLLPAKVQSLDIARHALEALHQWWKIRPYEADAGRDARLVSGVQRARHGCQVIRVVRIFSPAAPKASANAPSNQRRSLT